MWSEGTRFPQQSPALVLLSRVTKQLLGDELTSQVSFQQGEGSDWFILGEIHMRLFSSSVCANTKTHALLNALFSVTVCHTTLLPMKETISQQKKCDNEFMPVEFTCLTMYHITLKQLVR